MKKTIKPILVIIFLVFLGAGIYFFLNPKKALNIIIPQVEQVKNVHVMFAGDTARIDVDLALQNKGIFKLHIDSLSYRVSLDTADLLAKSHYVDLALARSESDTLRLPLALPFKRLIKKIKSLQRQDSTDLRIDVRIVYNTIFGTTALPYSKTIRIEVPRPPEFELERMEFVKRDKKTVHLLAHVRLDNKGKIDLKVSDIRYTMLVKDLFKASGRFEKEISVKPSSHMRLALPIQVEFKNVLKTIGMVITNNDKVNYNLKVNAMIQTDKVGQSKTPIEIDQNGSMELKK